MKLSKPVHELFVTAIVFGIAQLIVFAASIFMGNSAMDINLHDTYFVFNISSEFFVLPVFLVLMVAVYLVRCAVNGFKYRLQNLLLLIAGILFDVLLFITTTVVKIPPLEAGWTVYPPLSSVA